MNVGNAFSNVPEEMRLLPNWVLWRFEYPNGPDKKPTKRPYQANGKLASVTEPSHWCTFNEAFNQLQMGGFDGLGFIFTNTPYSGIDLDECSFLADGSPNPNYQNDLNRQIKIAHEFDSYSETSPSGMGLHIIVRGKVPDGKRRSFIEVYPSGRFFTMTGKVHNNTTIKDCQDLLTQLWTQLGGNPNPATTFAVNEPQTISDEEILALAAKHNAATFEPLHAGQWVGDYPSQSEADQAYLNIIAYYTNSRAQVERIFRNSKLMRSKVNTNKTYLPGSISTAFDLKMPPLDFEGMKEAFDKHKAKSKAVEVVEDKKPLELPPGMLGEIAQFIYAAAPRPVPEVALAAAIGLMAGICGRAYNISGTGLNQYVLLLAMTGAGKEAAASGINKLMNMIKMQVPTSTGFIGPSEISSGSALFKYLGNTSQSFISLLGEFGLRLQQMSSVNANGSEVSLRRMFLDLYNKSGSTEILHASVYSDKTNNTNAVPSPSFSILGESTPERFYGALNEDMISEGLLPRFLLIEYKGNRPPLNEHHTSANPNIDMITRFASLAAQCETINHSNPRKVVNVQSDAAATKLLAQFDKFADSKINSSNKDVIRQLWNRAHIKVLKLAALVAVGENMIEPTINERSFNWAANIVQADIATLTDKFEAGEIGTNDGEIKQFKEAVRVLKDYALSPFNPTNKYGAVEKQHKNHIVNITYLSRRLTLLAPFRNDRSGKTTALKRTIHNLIDEGRLIEVKGLDYQKYNTTAKLYYIHEDILKD